MMARLQILIVAVLLTEAVGSTKLRDAAQTTDPITAPTTARTAASTNMSDSFFCKVVWEGRGVELFNFVGKYYVKPGTYAWSFLFYLPLGAKVSIFMFFFNKNLLILLFFVIEDFH